MRVTVAGSDVAAGARTNSVDIVHRCLPLWEDGGGLAVEAGPQLGQRPPALRFVRGAAEGEAAEAAEPLQTFGRNEEMVSFTYRTMAKKLLTTLIFFYLFMLQL